VIPDLLVREVQLEHQDLGEPWDPLDQLDLPDHQDPADLLASGEREVNQVRQVVRETWVCQERWEYPEHQETMVTTVHLVPQEHKDLLDSKENEVFLVSQD